MTTCRNCDGPNDSGMIVCEGCFARFMEPPPPLEKALGGDSRWSTAAEISFLRGLDTAAVRKYAETAALRHNWDGIDAGAVMEECRRLLCQA